MRYRWHLLTLGAVVLFVVSSAVAIVSPESQAPFRLSASSEFVGVRAAADTHLSFDAIGWATTSPADGQGFRGAMPTAGNDPVVPDRIELWLHSGDDILLRREAGDSNEYSVVLPSRPAQMSIQRGARSTWTATPARGSGAASALDARSLRFSVGGSQSPALRFTVASGGSRVAVRMPASRIGFAAVTTQGMDPGLVSGSLHFLDKPEWELKLYRGTDLRLGDLDGELNAAQITKDGLEITASGRVTSADLVVQRNTGSDWRSVMPTRYEWLKGQPVLAVFLGFAAFAVTVAGFLLSLVQAFPALGAHVARWANK